MSMDESVTIEAPPRRAYFVSYKDLLPEDGSMSAKAYGILNYLIGRPPNWKAKPEHLTKVFKEGRDAIRAGLDELVDEHGLLLRVETREGNLRRINYRLAPIDYPDWRKRTAGFRAPESQEPGNTTVEPTGGTAGFRAPESQEPESQRPESQRPDDLGVVNKEVVTTEVATTEEAPKGPGRAASARPKIPSRRASAPAAAVQPTLTGDVPPPPAPTPRDVAYGVARRWLDRFADAPPTVPKGKDAIHMVASLVEPRLEHYSETEVCSALLAVDEPIPAAAAVDRALRNARRGTPPSTPAPRGRGLANRHIEPLTPEEREAQNPFTRQAVATAGDRW